MQCINIYTLNTRLVDVTARFISHGWANQFTKHNCIKLRLDHTTYITFYFLTLKIIIIIHHELELKNPSDCIILVYLETKCPLLVPKTIYYDNIWNRKLGNVPNSKGKLKNPSILLVFTSNMLVVLSFETRSLKYITGKY